MLTRVERRWLLWLALAAACNPRPARAPSEDVSAELWAVREADPVVIADKLETLIARGRATEQDREFAYAVLAERPVESAADAFARANVTGRLAEVRGLAAGSLVAEVERYARMSRRLNAAFRRGAATRTLGTLYVLAPAHLLEHGDSERGLALLRDLAARWPDDVATRLRLGEAYVALGDDELAREPLCYAASRRDALRPDERRLLERLRDEAGVGRCGGARP